MRQSFIRRLNEAASRIDFFDPRFSFNALREGAYRLAEMHEANSESTFGWLLRTAVQEFANEVYTDLPVIYPNLVAVRRAVPSVAAASCRGW
jgi:hypothetical protein